MLVTLFPIYWIASTALKGPLEVVSPIPTLFPHKVTFINFLSVLKSGFWKI